MRVWIPGQKVYPHECFLSILVQTLKQMQVPGRNLKMIFPPTKTMQLEKRCHKAWLLFTYYVEIDSALLKGNKDHKEV